jgi:hypothetical protein
MVFRIFIVLFGLLSLPLFAQNLRFYKEDIVFQLNRDTFEVSGDYFFKNDTAANINRSIFYPIYTDSLITTFESVSVYDYQLNQFIKFTKSNAGIFFNIKILANSSTKIKISYKQKLYGDYAVYILTSTKTWGKPLELANYSLISNSNLKIKTFSLKPDKEIKFNNKYIYIWSRKVFFPEKDFLIEYE